MRAAHRTHDAVLLLMICCVLASTIAAAWLLHRVRQTVAAPRAFVSALPAQQARVFCSEPLALNDLRAGDLVLFNVGIVRPFGETYHSAALALGGGVALCFSRMRASILPLRDKVKPRWQRRCAPVIVRRLELPGLSAEEQRSARGAICDAAAARVHTALGMWAFMARTAARAVRPPARAAHSDESTRENGARLARRSVCSALALDVLHAAGALTQPPRVLRSPDELLFVDCCAAVPRERRWSLPWNETWGAFWALPAPCPELIASSS